MSSKGHEPVRTCVVCNGKRAKWTLVRMALDQERKVVVVDSRQVAPGRGAYACRECLPRLRFNKRIQKAFRHAAKGLAEKAPGSSPVR